MKFRFVRFVQKYLLNPIMRPLHGFLPGTALLETTGNRTGKRRRNPVGGKLDGDTFWLVSEHGMRSGYVRNLTADPNVRVRVRARWRAGIAHTMPDDDAPRRAVKINPVNGFGVRMFGTQLLTVRIELGTTPSAPA